MTIRETAHAMKFASPAMAASDVALRNTALQAAADALREHQEEIFEANRQDLDAAARDNVPLQVQKRLLFNEAKLKDVTGGIEQLIRLDDPTGRVLLRRELDAGLTLTRTTVPIGVIGVIFEARPDALVQISSLCIKSGNCAVLKGGRETARTNRVLFDIIHAAVTAAGLPDECLYLATQHAEIDELLQCDGDVDLLIPRGSNNFVRYSMDHTKIPVMGHADGVCHIFVDRSADLKAALPLILDAKTQYPVACNAVETILVDRPVAEVFLPALQKALSAAGVQMRGTREALLLTGCWSEETLPAEAVMNEEDFHTEYGDLTLSVKVVEDVQEAVGHINCFGSHHTDCILSTDDTSAAYFSRMVDSAGVYRNCSTRFADGFRYGFGAEVGISTSKLHARGPVGLDGLVTYKYILEGEGQTVGQYASGEKAFHFRDLT